MVCSEPWAKTVGSKSMMSSAAVLPARIIASRRLVVALVTVSSSVVLTTMAALSNRRSSSASTAAARRKRMQRRFINFSFSWRPPLRSDDERRHLDEGDLVVHGAAGVGDGEPSVGDGDG